MVRSILIHITFFFLTNLIIPILALESSNIDSDGDGLLDITNIADLNNIRYDLLGSSLKKSQSDVGSSSGCPTIDKPIWVHNIEGTVLKVNPNNPEYKLRTRCYGYELMRDLDFKNLDSYVLGKVDTNYRASSKICKKGKNCGFTPIGEYSDVSQDNGFKGVFEGNHYTISNLYIHKEKNNNNVGLFGFIDINSVVRNIHLINVSIYGNRRVAGLVALNYGTITHTSVGGYVSGNTNVACLVGTNSSGTNVGGLVGVSKGVVIDSYATCSIDGVHQVGGLVGWSSGSIMNSYTNSHVNGVDFVGGLLGRNFLGGSISNSYSTGYISGITGVGGLVGYNDHGIIQDSYSTASIKGLDHTGGLVGENNAEITRCYATGYIYYSNHDAKGTTTKSQSLVLRAITGLVGLNTSPGVISDSYWDTATTGISVGIGMTEGTMGFSMHDIQHKKSTSYPIKLGSAFLFIDGLYPKVYKKGTQELVGGQ